MTDPFDPFLLDARAHVRRSAPGPRRAARASRAFRAVLAWLAGGCIATGAVAQSAATSVYPDPVTGDGSSVTTGNGSEVPSGPVRLRQSRDDAEGAVDAYGRPLSPAALQRRRMQDDRISTIDRWGVNARSRYGSRLPPPPESDFEAYVRTLPGGEWVQRYGVELMQPATGENDTPGLTATGAAAGLPQREVLELDNPIVPPDYVLRPGDEVHLTLWGSVDGDLRLRVDRSGSISIPRVGSVMVAGTRFADLPSVLSRRVGQVFRGFQLNVGLGQLRGQRVYVTGFVRRPGAVVVGNLATLAQAVLQAGGPAPNGSFRQIELRRGRSLVATFDLYDLLQRGDRGADLVLRPDDVIHVRPVGRQVAMVGAVNNPAIFELKPDETLADLLTYAGGFNAVADSGRLVRESLQQRSTGRVQPLALPADRAAPLVTGDVIRAFNAADLVLPTEKQLRRVRVDGEVAAPGDYILPASSTLGDAIQAAGGLTANAYIYGTTFTRESVRNEQQVNYERGLRDFETQLTMNAATRRTANAEEAAAATAATGSITRLMQQMRLVKPTGRVVLQVTPESTSLPAMVVEDGDKLTVPARPTTVGVFGSVFSGGSFLYDGTRSVGDYLRMAGGPRRGADEGAVFLIRANGTVTSSLLESGFFRRGNQIANVRTEPGDTIFVPEEMDKTTWIQGAKDWTQILYQFGLGVAGVKAATR